MNDDLLKRRGTVLGANMRVFYEEPVHIVRGERAWLYGADGKRYLDAYNNVPVVGHCHPRVVEALAKQASQLNVHTRYLHETIVLYGERLLGTLPETDEGWRASFVCTGSEANELALRLARCVTGKQGVICTDLTYHGNTAAVFELATIMSADAGQGRVQAVPYPQTYRPLDGVSGEALTQAYLEKVAQAIEVLKNSEYGFAGLLMCPILANEGLPTVPDRYWQGVADLVHGAGGLLIFDEVQSGFGRTGAMWGHAWTGVVPDVITAGKPMGNGHPLAAMLARADIFERFHAEARYFNTFGGNPVSCAAGMAVLNVLEDERLIENAAEIGEYLADKLNVLQERYTLIGDIRHYGLFFALDLVKNRKTKEGATAETLTIVNGMKEDGVLVSMIGRDRNVLKIRPPLVFGRDEADLLVAVLGENLEKIENKM